MISRLQTKSGQAGAALITALLILLIMTLIGLSALQTSMLDMRVSGSLKEKVTSFHLAESGLSWFENEISNQGVANIFAPDAVTSYDIDSEFGITSTTTGTVSFTVLDEAAALVEGYSVGDFSGVARIVTSDVYREGSHARSIHRMGIVPTQPGDEQTLVEPELETDAGGNEIGGWSHQQGG
ncbi:PilX N-terminal domain-containing pilus assembly protein [Solemya velesiana gill symbiont]|nr:PilX N-terminal domain-containing pilus assembly protein [Solemya velesiana gill symbiont]